MSGASKNSLDRDDTVGAIEPLQMSHACGRGRGLEGTRLQQWRERERERERERDGDGGR